jgi:iron complex outermembrane receptor protein
VNNPDFSKIPALNTFAAGSLQDQKTRVEDEGAYVSDLLTIDDHWKAQIGARFTKEMGHFEDPLNPKTNPARGETNNSVTKTAGLIYEPIKTWSVYADYSTSFAAVPMTSVGLTTNGVTNYAFHPTTGVSYEVGTKYASDDDRLTATLAGFRIDRQHVNEAYAQAPGTANLCPVAVSATCMVSVGAERSNGAELEVVAKPVKEWQIIAGYAYTDAKVQSNDFAPKTVGNQLANSPENAAHIWSRYDFASGDLKGFGFGLGASYIGDRVAYDGAQLTTTETKLPHYTVVDTVLYYEIDEKAFLTFKVNNLFNKIYYESGNSVSNLLSIQPGSPRIFVLSGKLVF